MIYRGLQSEEKSDLDGHEAEERDEKAFSLFNLHPHFTLLLVDVWKMAMPGLVSAMTLLMTFPQLLYYEAIGVDLSVLHIHSELVCIKIIETSSHVSAVSCVLNFVSSCKIGIVP